MQRDGSARPLHQELKRRCPGSQFCLRTNRRGWRPAGGLLNANFGEIVIPCRQTRREHRKSDFADAAIRRGPGNCPSKAIQRRHVRGVRAACADAYKDRGDIKVLKQEGKGRADAVRTRFRPPRPATWVIAMTNWHDDRPEALQKYPP